ncbi:hypothetical protein DN613_21230 [Aeromonas caviae]|nr:hypothetical protein DN613_21230 [Aeromonas caviae]
MHITHQSLGRTIHRRIRADVSTHTAIIAAAIIAAAIIPSAPYLALITIREVRAFARRSIKR